MLTEPLLNLLRPLIGLRDDDLINDAADTIPPGLQSKTGLTFDQCHDLLTLPTLRATMPQGIKNFPDYLIRTRDDAIRSLLDTIDTRLAEASLTPRLLKPTVLFAGSFGFPLPIIPAGRTVGLRIVAKQTDVTLSLDRLYMYGFTNPDFALKLTNIETGEQQTIALPDGSAWQDAGQLLRAGHTYDLTYNEADLGPGNMAYNTVTSWPKPQKPGCRNCLTGCLSHYAQIDAIADGETTRDTNFGINLVLSAAGDVSGRLLDNPRRLLPALRLQIAVTFLQKIVASRRKNPDTEEAIQAALFWLTDKDNTERVPLRLDRTIATLVKAMQTEASAALDIDQSDEITWGVV